MEKYKKLKPVRFPQYITNSYRKELFAIVRNVFKSIRFNLKDVNIDTLSEDFINKIFNDIDDKNHYKSVSTAFLTLISNYHLSHFRKNIKKTYLEKISIKKHNVGLQKLLDDNLKENVNLIKSINERAKEEILYFVENSDNTRMNIFQFLRQREHVSKSRASLIANDQTNKLISSLSELRNKNVGINAYFWSGMLDTRERFEHINLEGQLIFYDSPPSCGHAGQPIRCRCLQSPALEVI